MQHNTYSRPPRPYYATFDGIPTCDAEREGGEAALSLDLGTLNTVIQTAGAYGFTEYGSGTGWGWTVTSFGGNHFEVLGMHTTDGLKKSSGKRRKPSKPRATERTQMTDDDISRTMRRTKKIVREKTMMLDPDKLITLTTRKAIVEAEVFKAICSKFFRYCREAEMGMQYVAVFERHMSKNTSAAKFGSLHLHMAVNGYISYRQLRHLWRKAVQWKLKDGDYEGANIDASERKRKGIRGHYDRQSIARYLSKYLTKDMDDEYLLPNKRRYWASKGIKKPIKIRLFSPPATHFETFKQMWSDILGSDIRKVFFPDREAGQPPLVWLSTG